MARWNHLSLALASALLLSGCNLVTTSTPMFTVADSLGAPKIRPGVWRDENPNCRFDEMLPQNQWPACAKPQPAIDRFPGELEVAGDPDILQLTVPIFGPGFAATSFYFAYRPVALDEHGRVVRMDAWVIQCGPPPSRRAAAVARKRAQLALQSSADELGPPADQARLKAETSEPNVAADGASDDVANGESDPTDDLDRGMPTTAPLTGMTMNVGTGSCAPDSASTLRAAAKASEAWASKFHRSHWVRERIPGDLPPRSTSLSGDKSQ